MFTMVLNQITQMVSEFSLAFNTKATTREIQGFPRICQACGPVI
jgi:hypothetical protein